MSTGMRKWMEKACPDIPSLPAEVSIDREELRQLRDELAQYKNERDALRAKIEAMEQQEPVAWGAFYFGGKLNGKLYSQCATEAQIDKYIVDRHRSDDSNTFRKAALYALPGAQPAPSFADAYQGAMEDVVIWKKRALEAEDLNRKFVAEINGPAYMGEPAQPAPSINPAALSPVIDWLRNGCDPMKAADELEMLAAAPEAKP